MAINKVIVNGIKTVAKSAPKATKVKPSLRGKISSIFDADTTLFPFAKIHPPENAAGKLREKGMILCHMTEHLPTQDGKILSAFDAVKIPRNSVHFSVNHTVEAHFHGDWDNMSCCILMPMKATLKKKGNTFLGGVAQDFYSIGSVKIPKGSFIVRYAKDVPRGKLRVINADKIKQFKKLKGVRIIETSDKNIHEETNKIIKKLGYEVNYQFSSLYGGCRTEKILEGERKFVEFLQRKGLRSVMHGYTPNGNFESILLGISRLSKYDKPWVILNEGNVIYDYRKSFIEKFKMVKAFAEKEKLPLQFNIDETIKIINSSSSPSEAIKLLRKELGINMSAKKVQSIYSKFDYQFLKKHLENPIDMEVNNAVLKYCSNPSEETAETFWTIQDKLVETRRNNSPLQILKEQDLPKMEEIRKQEEIKKSLQVQEEQKKKFLSLLKKQ